MTVKAFVDNNVKKHKETNYRKKYFDTTFSTHKTRTTAAAKGDVTMTDQCDVTMTDQWDVTMTDQSQSIRYNTRNPMSWHQREQDFTILRVDNGAYLSFPTTIVVASNSDFTQDQKQRTSTQQRHCTTLAVAVLQAQPVRQRWGWSCPTVISHTGSNLSPAPFGQQHLWLTLDKHHHAWKHVSSDLCLTNPAPIGKWPAILRKKTKWLSVRSIPALALMTGAERGTETFVMLTQTAREAQNFVRRRLLFTWKSGLKTAWLICGVKSVKNEQCLQQDLQR